jgi:hypothetical protein
LLLLLTATININILVDSMRYSKSILLEDFTQEIKDIIIGCGLGDLHIRRRYKNTTLIFKQGFKNIPYIVHLYRVFAPFTGSGVKVRPNFRDGIKHYAASFDTLSYSAFNFFHDMFYIDGVKVVPMNIADWLTPRALAYWAMDDGGVDRSGFIFFTNCFDLAGIKRLQHALLVNFQINTNIHTPKTGALLIYIPRADFDKFKELVQPYFIPHFQYKLQLRGSARRKF